MVRAVEKIELNVGKLSLPLELFKATDETKSVSAHEVVRIDGKIYKVNRKAYVMLDDGSHKDVDGSQILKQYDKLDGSQAIFTKDEQSQLFKKGSDEVWKVDTIIPIARLSELSFQKDGMIATIELDKKKDIINQKNIKYLAMLKEGLGNDKALITKVLYKNTEYPVCITNYGNELLVRFIHYSNEIRDFSSLDRRLPTLTEQEKEQAKAFVNQYLKADFDLSTYQNETEAQMYKIIESRGVDVNEPSKAQEIALQEDNPFA